MAIERAAAFAGHFYPGDASACRGAVDRLQPDEGPDAAKGAIVPHAGWVYSGATAALSWAAIAAAQPETVVIFGAMHRRDRNMASLFSSGVWATPLGRVRVDDGLARRFSGCTYIREDLRPHADEHSIEVQLPFLQALLPEAAIVPINVRPGPEAVEVGRYCGAAAADRGGAVAFVGSTDLTHYGPAFGFEPHGRGAEGIRWAKDVNDRRFVDFIAQMDTGGVLADAVENRSACGAGAVAATIAAMMELGQDRYVELRHTTSAEIEGVGEPDPVNSVGYEAGVFRAS